MFLESSSCLMCFFSMCCNNISAVVLEIGEAIAIPLLVGDLFELYDDARTYKPLIYKCQTGR